MSKLRRANVAVSDNHPDYKQTYVDGSIADAGYYRVNVRTGKIDFTVTVFSANGNRLPMKLALTYNKSIRNVTKYLRDGWKFNYEQYVYASGNNLIYLDGKSREHTFKKLTATGAEYYDTEHTGLILTVVSGGYKITDGMGITLYFTGEKLTKIEEVTGYKDGVVKNEIIITNENGVFTVRDGMGRTANFTKSDDLVNVDLPGERTLKFLLYNGTFFFRGYNDRTRTYNFVQHGISNIQTSDGDYAEFTYSTDGKVTVIETGRQKDGEKYKLKKYTFSYGDGFTDVEEETFPDYGAKIKTRYVFAENGDFVSSYEIKNNIPAAVIVASQEEYRHYVSSVSAEEYVTGKFDIIRVPLLDELTVPLYGLNDSADLVFNYPSLGEGKNFVLSLTGEVLNLNYETNDVTIGIYINGNTKATYPCSFKKIPGKQIVAVKLDLTNEEIASGAKLYLYFGDAGEMTFSGLKLTKEKKRESAECLTVNTGGVQYAFGSTTYYECEDAKMNGTIDCVMTGRDWQKTLENCYRSPSDFIMWSNDLSCAYRVGASLFFTFGQSTTQISVSEITYALVSTVGTKQSVTTFTYGTGDNYVISTMKTREGNEEKTCYSYYNQYYNLVKSVDSNGTQTLYTYDEFGNVTKITEKNDSENLTKSKEYEYGTIRDGVVTYDGGYLLGEASYYGSRRIEYTYDYYLDTGNLKYEKEPSKYFTPQYEYNADGTLKKVNATKNSVELKNELSYANGDLTSTTTNGESITYEYDEYGNIAKYARKRNDTEETLLKRSLYYTSNPSCISYYTDYLERHRDFVRETYDEYGNLCDCMSYNLNGASSAKFIYAAVTDVVDENTEPFSSNLTKNRDAKLRLSYDAGEKVLYNYAVNGALIKTERLLNNLRDYIEYTYDENGRLTQKHETGQFDGIKTTYDYYHGDALNDEKLKTTTVEVENMYVPSSIVTTDVYDGIHRLKSRSVTSTLKGYRGMSDTVLDYGSTYGYARGKDGEASDVLSFVVRKLPDGTSFLDEISRDGGKNIAALKLSDKYIHYTYDDFRRLVRENNQATGKTYIYTYDENGNRLTLGISNYTTGTVTSSDALITYNYDPNFKDRLVGITKTTAQGTETKTVSGYMNFECPTSYLGMSMSWQNRRLLSVTNGTTTTRYVYTSANVRLEKRGAETTVYGYNGTTLSWEKRGDNVIKYLYDQTGISGFTYNSGRYIYDKNVFGDIVGIYTIYGVKVAEYAYDAFGNCVITYNNGSGIAELNPFRYRGYYYDTETGFYYLINRYYDPTTGRFISADSLDYLDPETLGGLNLFAYCLNDPIANTDPEGTIVFSLFVGMAIAFAVGAISSAVSQGVTYGWDNINIGQVVVDGIFAAGSAALASTGIGILASGAIGAAMGFGQYAIGASFHGEELTLRGSITSTLLGFGGGLLSGAGARNAKSIAESLTGRADQGVRALATAAQKYGINSKQVGLVQNLYGSAIRTATEKIVNESFTKGIKLICGWLAFNSIISIVDSIL